MMRLRTAVGGLAACALLLGPAAAFARATLIINNQNAPGEGFNDPTPAPPVGGNPGTTVGEQRLIAFEFAASLWGATITSAQTIVIDAQFTPMTCGSQSIVLGAAGPESTESADPKFPESNIWYPSALANAFAGADFNPRAGDISANFNSNLGTASCDPGGGWYYGLDGKAPSNLTDLPTVLLHEFSHGLGFITYAEQSGANPQGIPDIFEKFTYDQLIGKAWIDMTDAERAASTLHPEQVIWTGSNVNAIAPLVLQFPVLLSITAPVGDTGDLAYVGAAFGPKPTSGLTGQVDVVQDAQGGSLADACRPVTGVNGKVALVDRLPKSTSYTPCTFKTKAANVQAAGAIAMIVDDFPNDASPPGGMADDLDVTTAITVPSVLVSNDSGNQLRNALATGGGVAAITFHDGTPRAGADATDEPYLYTPATYSLGSSVSHWSLEASPPLLMEPEIHADIPLGLDLTPSFMQDLGWQLGADVTLAVAKAGPVEAWPGGSAQYLITVLNHGTTEAQNVVVTADNASGLAVKSVTGAGCTALPCTVGTIPADSRATLLVTYDIPLDYTTPDPVVENVSFTSSAGSGPDNTVRFTSPVQQAADLSITANLPASLKSGDKQSVPLTITNEGPSVATNVDVTTNSPTQVELMGFSGDCAGSPCHFDSLQPGETKSVNLMVKPSGGNTASFQVAVGGGTSDPNAANNNLEVKLNVTGGGCTAAGDTSLLSLVALWGGLLLRRRNARA